MSYAFGGGNRASLIEKRHYESLKLATDIAVISEGKVLVADGVNHRLVLFTLRETQQSKKELTRVIQFPELKRPLGLCSDNNGGAWITDTTVPALFHIDANFHHIQTIKLADDVKPTDVLLDGETLFVVDNANHSILKMDIKGNVLSRFGGKGDGRGQMTYPAMIAQDENGLLYITDVLNARIVIFDRAGKYLGHLGEYGVAQKNLYRPKGICISQLGDVYVSDSYLNKIIMFDTKGKGFILEQPNYGPIKFDNPLGLAIWGKDFYVLESFNSTLRKLELENP